MNPCTVGNIEGNVVQIRRRLVTLRSSRGNQNVYKIDTGDHGITVLGVSLHKMNRV